VDISYQSKKQKVSKYPTVKEGLETLHHDKTLTIIYQMLLLLYKVSEGKYTQGRLCQCALPAQGQKRTAHYIIGMI
jgi:hypothetical protein